MSDYTETTRTGFFAKIKNAIFGALVGVVLIPASIGLLSWNEYRTIHRTQGLNEGAELVETVADPDNASPKFAGKLVHLNGKADTKEELRDDVFGIEENAIRLTRNVQMFQWTEDKQTKTQGDTKKTTYSYRQEWQRGRVDDANFKRQQGHSNPQPKFPESDLVAKRVNLGAYLLNSQLIDSIRSTESVPWSDEMLTAVEPMYGQTTVSGKYLYWSKGGNSTPETPAIGDQRIWFEVVRPTRVSLVSSVSSAAADQLKPFKTSNGESLQRLYVGDFTAAEVFDKMQSENRVTAWLFRAGGFAMSFMGFAMIFGVLSAFTDYIPVVGSMTRGLVGLVAFLMAVVLTTLTIAFAWIAVRPLLAIPLIVIGLGAAYMAWRSSRKKSAPAFQTGAEAPAVLSADDVV